MRALGERAYSRSVSRAEGTDDRRMQLLVAATAVIARVGFDRLRLRDVADEAGVSIGLIQHYFETREQLGREAFAFVCRDRAKRIVEASGEATTSWQRIETYLREALEWRDLTGRAKTWLDLTAAASRDPIIKEQTALSFEIWRAPLLRAIDDGTLSGEFHPVVSSQAAADAILALIDGTELRVVADHVDDDPAIGVRTLDTALVIARHLLGTIEPGQAPARARHPTAAGVRPTKGE